MTNTFPLKYRRKSSPPASPPLMLSPIVPSFSSSSSSSFSFLSPPPPKWLDSDDDFDHEPALTSDDALTVFSSTWSRAPSLAPLDSEDTHVDIVTSPLRETFFRAAPSSRAAAAFPTRYNNNSNKSKSYSPDAKTSSQTREDVAAALLALHAQPRLGPSQSVHHIPTTQNEAPQPPPARRRRVVTPSLRNLVLPRTPSPPPRLSLPLTTPPPVIDRRPVHATTPPAQRTSHRPVTPASSPLPPSSPFAEEETDCEASELTTFHSVPCPKPKSEAPQADTHSDDSEADKHAPSWSRDDEPKEECDRLPMIVHEEVLRPASFEASPLTATTPNERYLICERLTNALPRPVLDTVSSTASSQRSGDQREILFPMPVDDPNGAHPPHVSRPRSESPVLAAPSPSTQAQTPSVLLPSDSSLPDTMDQDAPALAPAPALVSLSSSSSSCSRAASSALTALEDEQSSSSTPPRASPSHPHDNTGRCPASSPLSSPPSSPSPGQQRWRESSSSSSSSSLAAGRVVGTKRHAPPEFHPNADADADVDAAPSVFVLSAAPAPPEHAPARARVKRRRRNSDSDDKPWRDRKKLHWASTPAQQQQQQPCPPAPTPAPASTSTSPLIPAPPPPRASSSPSSSTPTPTTTTTTTTTTPTTTTTTTAPTSTYTPTTSASPTADPNPCEAPDDDKICDDDEEEDRPCPHPALLGILIEALALSRASSLPLSTLTRTTPALAGYPPAALTSTLAWAVRSRILGSVRSSGEALPPSYFYDPAEDPDRDRGELLRGLMPRAGKRRETMKYKQYYWAPVVVGRGRTRAWDVDWEE